MFAFPNPAKETVTIRFVSNAFAIDGSVVIYDVTGTAVRVIANSDISLVGNGLYHAVWDTTNSAGSRVASGVYLFVVKVKDTQTGERRQVTKKLAIIR